MNAAYRDAHPQYLKNYLKTGEKKIIGSQGRTGKCSKLLNPKEFFSNCPKEEFTAVSFIN